jgi:hypothetical protein
VRIGKYSPTQIGFANNDAFKISPGKIRSREVRIKIW